MLLALAIALPFVNPVGYVGGGADDSHYLNAARCWVDAGGPCLPGDHWQSRWPAIAPLAATIGIGGVTRAAVSAAPFAGFLATLMLVFHLGRTWFDARIGALAALLFAATPVVALTAFQPNVDTVELALQLGALALASAAWRRQSPWLAAAGGVVAALAVQARDTSLLFCAAAALAWLLLEPERRRVLLWALPGFALAAMAEPLVYWAATGDPLYRFRLSLGHVAIPSAELAASVDTSRAPFFNPDYIAGWRRDAGIALWWPIDPWLNLVASPRSGPLLIALAFAAPAGWRALGRAGRRMVALALGGAALVALGLVYALAVDPKPRMFLLLIAAAALATAALASAAARVGRGAVPLTAALLAAGMGTLLTMRTVNTHEFERAAARWIAAAPGRIEIEAKTASTLALVEAARGLPGEERKRPLIIAATNEGCPVFKLPVVASVGEKGTGALCLIDQRARVRR